jgi:hypothetical protein
MALSNFWFQADGILSAKSKAPQSKKGGPLGPPGWLFSLFDDVITQKINLALSCICRMLVAVVVYALKFGEANWLT